MLHLTLTQSFLKTGWVRNLYSLFKPQSGRDPGSACHLPDTQWGGLHPTRRPGLLQGVPSLVTEHRRKPQPQPRLLPQAPRGPSPLIHIRATSTEGHFYPHRSQQVLSSIRNTSPILPCFVLGQDRNQNVNMPSIYLWHFQQILLPKHSCGKQCIRQLSDNKRVTSEATFSGDTSLPETLAGRGSPFRSSEV